MGFKMALESKAPLSFYIELMCLVALCSDMASPSPVTTIYISLMKPVLNTYKWIVLKAVTPAISLTF